MRNVRLFCLAAGLFVVSVLCLALSGEEDPLSTRGKSLLQYSLERAGSFSAERAGDWAALVQVGAKAAMADWEKDAAARLDAGALDAAAYAGEKADAEGWVAGRVAEGFAEWMEDKFFGALLSKAEGELSAAARAANANLLYEKDASGEAMRDEYGNLVVRPEASIAADKAAWKAAGDAAKLSALAGMDARFQAAFPELQSRLSALSPAQRDRLVAVAEARFDSFQTKAAAELDGIARIEEFRFVGMRSVEVLSLRQKSEAEAAAAVVQQQLRTTQGKVAEGIDALQARIDEAGAGAGDLALKGGEWLALYTQQFARGMEAWRRAEADFLARRVEWEKEAEQKYKDGGDEWAKAYEKLASEKRAWMVDIGSLLDAGASIFKAASEELSSAISRAQTEFASQAEEKMGATATKAQALADYYGECASGVRTALDSGAYWLGELESDKADADKTRFSVACETKRFFEALAQTVWAKVEEGIAKTGVDEDLAPELIPPVAAARAAWSAYWVSGSAANVSALVVALQDLSKKANISGYIDMERWSALSQAIAWKEQVKGYMASIGKARKDLMDFFGANLMPTEEALRDVLKVDAKGDPTAEALNPEMAFSLDEYQIALLKAKAVGAYWDKRYSIAAAVYAYASATKEGKTSWTETEAAYAAALGGLEAAKTAYSAAVAKLEAAGGALQAKRQAITDAQKALEAKSAELAKANADYAALRTIKLSGGATYYEQQLRDKYASLYEASGLASGSVAEASYAEYAAAMKAYALDAGVLRADAALKTRVEGRVEGASVLAPSLATLRARAAAAPPPADAPEFATTITQAIAGLSLDAGDPSREILSTLQKAWEKAVLDGDPKAGAMKEVLLAGFLRVQKRAQAALEARKDALALYASGTGAEWYAARAGKALGTLGLEDQLQADLAATDHDLLADRIATDMAVLDAIGKGGTLDGWKATVLALARSAVDAPEAALRLGELGEVAAALGKGGDAADAELEALAGASDFIARYLLGRGIFVWQGMDLTTMGVTKDGARERAASRLDTYRAGITDAPALAGERGRKRDAALDAAFKAFGLSYATALPPLLDLREKFLAQPTKAAQEAALVAFSRSMAEAGGWARSFEKEGLAEYAQKVLGFLGSLVDYSLGGSASELTALIEAKQAEDKAQGDFQQALRSSPTLAGLIEARSKATLVGISAPAAEALIVEEAATDLAKARGAATSLSQAAYATYFDAALAGQAYAPLDAVLKGRIKARALELAAFADALAAAADDDPADIADAAVKEATVAGLVASIDEGAATSFVGDYVDNDYVNGATSKAAGYLLRSMSLADIEAATDASAFDALRAGAAAGGFEAEFRSMVEGFFTPSIEGRKTLVANALLGVVPEKTVDGKTTPKIDRGADFLAALAGYRAGVYGLADYLDGHLALACARQGRGSAEAEAFYQALAALCGLDSYADAKKGIEKGRDGEALIAATCSTSVYYRDIVLHTLKERLIRAGDYGALPEFKALTESFGTDAAGDADRAAIAAFAARAAAYRAQLGAEDPAARALDAHGGDAAAAVQDLIAATAGAWDDAYFRAGDWLGAKETLAGGEQYLALVAELSSRKSKALGEEQTALAEKYQVRSILEAARDDPALGWRSIVAGDLKTDADKAKILAAEGIALDVAGAGGAAGAFQMSADPGTRRSIEAYNLAARAEAQLAASLATADAAPSLGAALVGKAEGYLDGGAAAWTDLALGAGVEQAFRTKAEAYQRLLQGIAASKADIAKLQDTLALYRLTGSGLDAKLGEMLANIGTIQGEVAGLRKGVEGAASSFAAAGAERDAAYAASKGAYRELEVARTAFDIQEAIREYASTAYLGADDATSPDSAYKSPREELDLAAGKKQRAADTLAALEALYESEKARVFAGADYEAARTSYADAVAADGMMKALAAEIGGGVAAQMEATGKVRSELDLGDFALSQAALGAAAKFAKARATDPAAAVPFELRSIAFLKLSADKRKLELNLDPSTGALVATGDRAVELEVANFLAQGKEERGFSQYAITDMERAEYAWIERFKARARTEADYESFSLALLYAQRTLMKEIFFPKIETEMVGGTEKPVLDADGNPVYEGILDDTTILTQQSITSPSLAGSFMGSRLDVLASHQKAAYDAIMAGVDKDLFVEFLGIAATDQTQCDDFLAEVGKLHTFKAGVDIKQAEIDGLRDQQRIFEEKAQWCFNEAGKYWWLIPYSVGLLATGTFDAGVAFGYMLSANSAQTDLNNTVGKEYKERKAQLSYTEFEGELAGSLDAKTRFDAELETLIAMMGGSAGAEITLDAFIQNVRSAYRAAHKTELSAADVGRLTAGFTALYTGSQKPKSVTEAMSSIAAWTGSRKEAARAAFMAEADEATAKYDEAKGAFEKAASDYVEGTSGADAVTQDGLKAAAKAAFSGTLSRKQVIADLAKVDGDVLFSGLAAYQDAAKNPASSVATRATLLETLSSPAALASLESYKGSISSAYSARLSGEEEYKGIEWGIRQLELSEKSARYYSRAALVKDAGVRAWRLGEDSFNSSRSRWSDDFQVAYKAKGDEWDAKYQTFLDKKLAWVGRATKAADEGASETTLYSLGNDAEAEERATLADEVLSMSGDTKADSIVATLFASEGIKGAAGALRTLAEAGTRFDTLLSRGSGTSAPWDAAATAAAISEIVDGKNEELATLSALLLADKAKKMVEAAEKSVTSQIKSANEGMVESMDALFVDSAGYKKTGNTYSKEIIVNSTLFTPIITELVSIEGFRPFALAEPFRVSFDLSRESLKGMDSFGIQALIGKAQDEVAKEMEDIFGKRYDDTDQGKADAKADAEKRKVSKDITVKEEYFFTAGADGVWRIYGEQDKKLRTEERSYGAGKFGEHVGYAPIFIGSPDLSGRPEDNVLDAGMGQMGRIQMKYTWASMKESKGIGEVMKPAYEKDIWDDTNSWIDAPSLRTVTDIAVSIAATAVGNVWIAALINTAEDAAFTVADIATGYKTAAQAGTEFAKKAVSRFAVAGVGDLFGNTFGGVMSSASNSVGDVLAKTAISGLQSMTTNVVSSAVNAFNLDANGQLAWDGDSFMTGAFGKGAMAGVLGGMAGTAVTEGLNTDLFGFVGSILGDAKTLTSTIGGLVNQGVQYAMTGSATFNVLNFGDIFAGAKAAGGGALRGGLFAITIGGGGIRGAVSSSGMDMSVSTIASSIRGFEAFRINAEIRGSKESEATEYAAALRTLYSSGNGDVRLKDGTFIEGADKKLFEEILTGNANVVVAEGLEGTAVTLYENGRKTIYLGADSRVYRAGLSLGVVFSHEAMRDGKDAGVWDQKRETAAAVSNHWNTEALISASYGEGSLVGAIGEEAKDYLSALKGLADTNPMAKMAAEKKLEAMMGEYDSSSDYWKRVTDSSGKILGFEYDGKHGLYDEKENLLVASALEEYDASGNFLKVKDGYSKEADFKMSLGNMMGITPFFDTLGEYDAFMGNSDEAVTEARKVMMGNVDDVLTKNGLKWNSYYGYDSASGPALAPTSLEKGMVKSNAFFVNMSRLMDGSAMTVRSGIEAGSSEVDYRIYDEKDNIVMTSVFEYAPGETRRDLVAIENVTPENDMLKGMAFVLDRNGLVRRSSPSDPLRSLKMAVLGLQSTIPRPDYFGEPNPFRSGFVLGAVGEPGPGIVRKSDGTYERVDGAYRAEFEVGRHDTGTINWPGLLLSDIGESDTRIMGGYYYPLGEEKLGGGYSRGLSGPLMTLVAGIDYHRATRKLVEANFSGSLGCLTGFPVDPEGSVENDYFYRYLYSQFTIGKKGLIDIMRPFGDGTIAK